MRSPLRCASSAVALLSLLAPLASGGCAWLSAPSSPPVTAAAAAAPAGLTFIEDDYAHALAEAKASGKPLFIDAWAPWCHTCLSMRSYVFTDPKLAPFASRFVWLAIDTEKPGNAGFVEKYPMQSWPTLWVVDSKTEEPALKWIGSATAPELALLLEDVSTGATAGTEDAEATAALIRGERATAAGKRDDAIREYQAALAAAPPRWKKRARADEALVSELWAAKDDTGCAALADGELAKISPGTSLANVALLGLQCARRAPAKSPTHALSLRLARAVEQIALDPSVPMLDDDRSSLFEETVSDRSEDGDDFGAKSLATSWAKLLEARAAAAPTPAARAVFDAHRMLAYVVLGDAGRALPMLAATEKDFPDDYNPAARIARVDLELHHYDEAVTAAQRALSKAYGPRKVKIYLLLADILKAKGDAPGVARVVDEATTYAAGLPAAERPTAVLAELDKRRAPAPK